MNAKTLRTLAASAAIATATGAVTSAAMADGYQYMISGDPIASATVGVDNCETANVLLNVRQRAVAESATVSLEVRQHAVVATRTIALSSKKPVGFIMIVR